MNKYISNAEDTMNVKFPDTVIPIINNLVDSNRLVWEEIQTLDMLSPNQKIYLRRVNRYLDRILSAYYDLRSIEYNKRFLDSIPILESLGGVFKSPLADLILKLAGDGNKYKEKILYVASLYYSFVGDVRSEDVRNMLDKFSNSQPIDSNGHSSQ